MLEFLILSLLVILLTNMTTYYIMLRHKESSQFWKESAFLICEKYNSLLLSQKTFNLAIKKIGLVGEDQ